MKTEDKTKGSATPFGAFKFGVWVLPDWPPGSAELTEWGISPRCFRTGDGRRGGPSGQPMGERQRIFDRSPGGQPPRIGDGLGAERMDGRTTGLVRGVNLRIVKAALRMDKASQGNLRMNFCPRSFRTGHYGDKYKVLPRP
jgi:hypothetical protein